MPYTKSPKTGTFTCQECGRVFFATYTTRKPLYHDKTCHNRALARRKAQKRKQATRYAPLPDKRAPRKRAMFDRFEGRVSLAYPVVVRAQCDRFHRKPRDRYPVAWSWGGIEIPHPARNKYARERI